MVHSTLPKLGVPQDSVDTDLWPGRTGWNAMLATIEDKAAGYSQGTTAARPAAGIAERFYFATETQRLWVDNGTSWIEVAPVGGGGSPPQLDIGDGGQEGVSRIAARADHQHALPVAAVDPGAIAYGGAAARGSSITVARADHTHALTALPLSASVPHAISVGGPGAIGVATALARSDHEHALPVPDLDPVQVVPGGTASRGSSTTPARADHTHSSPALPFATAAAPPTSVDIGDTQVVGVSTSLARADHQHAVAAPAAPATLLYGQSGVAGSATTFARADHQHALDLSPYEITATAYTPVLSATRGGNLSGFSGLDGRYRKHGPFCDVWVDLTFGALGIVNGSVGSIHVSLPFAAAQISTNLHCALWMGTLGVETYVGHAAIEVGNAYARPHFPLGFNDCRLLPWASYGGENADKCPAFSTYGPYAWGVPPGGTFTLTGTYVTA